MANAGAVTWGDGANGVTGVVGIFNSLVGDSNTIAASGVATSLQRTIPDNVNETFLAPFVGDAGGRVRLGSQNSGFAPTTLSVGDSSIVEGGAGKSIMAFTLSLSDMTAADVRVNYATANSTATSGTDYTAATGSFTIPAGTKSRQLTILVGGDPFVEPDETFTVALSNPVGVALGKSIGTGTIGNDDPAVPATTVTQYRLYHEGTKEHLYTTDVNEYNVLSTRGWAQEGVAYKMLTNGVYDSTPTVPLFRLYHPGVLQHHWTTDSNEAMVLSRLTDWFYEGTIGYLLPAPGTGTVPLYRMSFLSPPLHLWTTDLNEYNTLAGRGWVKEGVIGHVIP